MFCGLEIIPSGTTCMIWFLGLGICFWPCSSIPWDHGSDVNVSSLLEGSTCFRWVVVICIFSTYRILELWQSSLCPVSVSFIPSWECFCKYNILKNLLGPLFNLMGIQNISKRVLHRSFLDNSISFPDLCWEFEWIHETQNYYLQQNFSHNTVGLISIVQFPNS